MSYRDDFNSSMNSPGNYSGGSNWGKSDYRGNYGGSNNPGGGGYTTIAQKNFSRAGGSFGPGAGFGSLLGNSNDGIQSGPIQPALGPQGVPTPNLPAPNAYPPPGRQLTPEELARLAAQQQYSNPFRWPTQRRANMAVTDNGLPYNNGYNGRPPANYPPTPVWAGGPSYNQNVGGLVGGSGGHAMGGGWNPNSGSFGGPR